MIIKNVETEFLPLHQYVQIAKNTIQRFCPTYTYLLTDVDAIDYVVHKIMIGDWKWKPEKSCSRITYRCSCAQWAIREYAMKIKPRYSRYKTLHNYEPYSGAKQKWLNQTELEDLSLDINDFTFLTDNERLCIKKIYIEHYRIKDVAEECEISRPAIYKICESAIEKIKENFGV